MLYTAYSRMSNATSTILYHARAIWRTKRKRRQRMTLSSAILQQRRGDSTSTRMYVSVCAIHLPYDAILRRTAERARREMRRTH